MAVRRPLLTPGVIEKDLSPSDLILHADIDPSDQRAVAQVMAEFNMLPFEVRKRLTDQPMSLPSLPEVAAEEQDEV